MQTADIRYRFTGDSSDLVAAGKEAQAALDATGREAQVAGKKVGDSFDNMGDKAGKVGGAAKKLRGALGAISPELANMAGAVDDAADALEVLSAGGTSFGAVAGAIGVTLAALGAAYYATTREIEKESAALEQGHRLSRELVDVSRSLETVQLDLAHAYGRLSDAQLGQAKAALTAQAAVMDFAEGHRDERKQLQSSLATIDAYKTTLGSIPWVYERGMNAAIDYLGGTEDLRNSLGRLDNTEAEHTEKQKQLRILMQELTAATDAGTTANDARNASLEKTVSLQDQIQAELDALAIAAENNEKRDRKIADARNEQLQAEIDAIDNQRALEEQHAAWRAEQEEQRRELTAKGIDQNVDDFARLGDAVKEYGAAGFAVWKASALAQIAVSTITASMRAIAELGPIAGPISAALIAATGAVAAGEVAAEQPTFHMGGSNNRVDEVNATLQRGETVLTARGTAEIVSAINRGQMGGGGGGPQIQVYEHRAFGRFIRDEVRAPTVLGTAITSSRSVMPGRRPRRN
jgi:hypothetical protein